MQAANKYHPKSTQINTVVVLTTNVARYTNLFAELNFPDSRFIFITPKQHLSLEEKIQNLKKRLQNSNLNISLILGLTDRLSLMAALLNQYFGLRAVLPIAIANTQHKAFFLKQAKKHNLPTPPFFIMTHTKPTAKPIFDFPLFVKPSRGALSVRAKKIDNQRELEIYNKSFTNNRDDEVIMSLLRNEMEVSHIPPLYSSIVQPLITADQYTAEISSVAGVVQILTVTKTIYNNKHTSFYEFCLPINTNSFLPQLQHVAESIASFTGLNNTCFNIEFFLTQDNKLLIIECNTRPSLQFLQIISYTHDTSYLRTIVAAALGKQSTWVPPKKNRSARIRVFRRNDDAFVLRSPNQAKQKAIKEKFGLLDLVIFAQPGKKLSQQLQDAYTFRYGYVAFAGSERELDKIWGDLHSELGVVFATKNFD